MNLKRRIELLERKLRPGELCAVIQGNMGDNDESIPLVDADYPRLQEDVNDDGDALISRWACVTFFEGTRKQQNTRLKQLRLDPQYQKPWNNDGIPVWFEGGATMEDALSGEWETEQHDKLLLLPTS